MAQRIITGPIVNADGTGLPSGKLRLTRLDQYLFDDDESFELPVDHAIVDGAVSATAVVGDRYRLEIRDASGEALRVFTATIPDGAAPELTVRALWESRGEIETIPAPMVRRGDSILRLATKNELGWGMLVHGGSGPEWRTTVPGGDMRSEIYDPDLRRVDFFNRANHTGEQAIETMNGLSDLLETIGGAGFDEYAVVVDRKPAWSHGGTFTNGADRLRTFNTIELNNSGLDDNVLFDAAASAVRLEPGRIYFGWAVAPTSAVGHNYLRIKSLDGAIDIAGPSYHATVATYPEVNVWARVQFYFRIDAGAGSKSIQLFHRCEVSQNTVGMGNAVRFIFGEDDEEYAKLTILSRPIVEI